MAYYAQSKVILWSGIFCWGLYALISFGFNVLDSEQKTYFYLVILFFLLYLIYFFLWQYFDKKDLSNQEIKKISVFSILFILTLIFLVPQSPGDFYHYIFEDAVLVSYNQNPYLVAPHDLPGEPLGWMSNWRELPSQHGPFKFFLTQVPFYLSQGYPVPAIFLYKFLYSLFFVGSVYLVYKILNHLQQGKKNLAFLLFAWNPLIIFTPHISGGNDILLLLWTLLAIYMVVKNKFYRATLFLTFSILVKYVTVILLPLFFIYYISKEKNLIRKGLILFKHVLLFSLVSALLFLPFWEGPKIFTGLTWVGQYFSANSVPGLLFIGLKSAGINFPISFFKLFFEGLFVIIFVVVLWRLLFSKNISPEKFLKYLALTLFLFLLVGKFWLFYKYFAWLIPLIYLLGKKYFAYGVFLTGLIVFGEVYLGYIIVLLIPAIVLFSFYFLVKDKINFFHA